MHDAQRDGILEVLLQEVHAASQHDDLQQHMVDSKLVGAAQLSTAFLVSTGALACSQTRAACSQSCVLADGL
jgi:hypothetical protein